MTQILSIRGPALSVTRMFMVKLAHSLHGGKNGEHDSYGSPNAVHIGKIVVEQKMGSILVSDVFCRLFLSVLIRGE